MLSASQPSYTGIRQCFIAAVVAICVFSCLPTTSTALPMKEAMSPTTATTESEQLQQQHREKRAVTDIVCQQPANLQELFQQINSGLNSSHFLHTLASSHAIAIADGEYPVLEEGDPNETKTCPATLTRDSSAPVAHRSLCPYYFNILRFPQGYYPQSLRSATCKCQQCVENTAYGCEAIVTNVVVLKPVGCFGGLQKYQEEIVRLNTACACAFSGSSTTVASG